MSSSEMSGFACSQVFPRVPAGDEQEQTWPWPGGVSGASAAAPAQFSHPCARWFGQPGWMSPGDLHRAGWEP